MKKWVVAVAVVLVIGTGLELWLWLHPRPLNQETHIIIDKSLNRLYLFSEGQLVRHYPVATGREPTLTPEGCFTIVNQFALTEDSNSQLGAYWLGLSAPPGPLGGHYGIHGTDEPESIGRHLSAGCIRLGADDIEQLYQTVDTGTLVCIRRGPLWLWQLGDWWQERITSLGADNVWE